MSVYRRYFRVPEDSHVGVVMKNIMAKRKAYFAALKELQKEVGAESVHFYTLSGEFAGFKFVESKRDNDLWRKPDKEGLVCPRLSSRGKEMDMRISSLRTASLEGVYEAAGLGNGRFLMNSGMTMYNASLGFVSDPFTLIVSVPWKDIDPEELEEYRRDESRRESSMEHLLWEVPEDWEEIKEWQATKALDEAKGKSEEAA